MNKVWWKAKGEQMLRISSKHRRWLPIFVGCLSSVIVLSVAHWLKREKPTIESPRYLIAARPIEKGERFSFRALTYLQGTNAPDDTLTDQDLSEFERRIYSTDIPMKGWVRRSDFKEEASDFASDIPTGFRAYPIRPGNFLSLRANDLVDVYFVPSTSGSKIGLLLEEVKVLGTRSKGTEVLLALSEVEIELVEKGLKQGKLNLALHRALPGTKQRGASRRGRRPKKSFFETRNARPRIEILNGEK